MKGRKRDTEIILRVQPPRQEEREAVVRQFRALSTNDLAKLAADLDFLGRRAKTVATRVFASPTELRAAIRAIEREADKIERASA